MDLRQRCRVLGCFLVLDVVFVGTIFAACLATAFRDSCSHYLDRSMVIAWVLRAVTATYTGVKTRFSDGDAFQDTQFTAFLRLRVVHSISAAFLLIGIVSAVQQGCLSHSGEAVGEFIFAVVFFIANVMDVCVTVKCLHHADVDTDVHADEEEQTEPFAV